jgi:glucose-1-phosphate thymidylyltransferase
MVPSRSIREERAVFSREENTMKGVILAAGKGSRLYPATYTIPKPLLPLANRPTIHYAFDRLKEMGVTDICIVVGEMEAQMKAALGSGSNEGVNLTYVRQPEPKGLAHAVGFTKDFVGGDSFVLYLGDAIYGSGFSSFANHFKETGCANLNIVKAVDDPSRFGVANVNGERIVKLVEKPAHPESNLAMAGMYFFGPQLWNVLPDMTPSARGEYEITDAIQMMIDRGETVLAGVYDGAWFDTGTLDSFLETSSFLTEGDALVGAGATTHGEVLTSVVIGDNASVECQSIEDSVVLPGTQVKCAGHIRHSLISGNVDESTDIVGQILAGLAAGATV